MYLSERYFKLLTLNTINYGIRIEKTNLTSSYNATSYLYQLIIRLKNTVLSYNNHKYINLLKLIRIVFILYKKISVFISQVHKIKPHIYFFFF